MRSLRNALLLLIILGIAGIVAGYFIFARAPFTGELIEIRNLIPQSQTELQQWTSRLLNELGFEQVRQLEVIRRNILMTGAGGALLGLILGFVVSRR